MTNFDKHGDRDRPAPPASPPRRLADHVYDRLIRSILEEGLEPGMRLEPESALARRFGASRPVIREALRHLKADGLIESRQGSGHFVRRRPDSLTFGFAVGSIRDIQRCYEYRAAVETAAAALAAQRHTPSHLARLEAATSAFEDCVVRGEPAMEADYAFHLAVAQATLNPFFESTLESLRPAIGTAMTLALTLSQRHFLSRQPIVLREHRQIVAAIAARDADAARAAMTAHIDGARTRTLGRLPGEEAQS